MWQQRMPDQALGGQLLHARLLPVSWVSGLAFRLLRAAAWKLPSRLPGLTLPVQHRHWPLPVAAAEQSCSPACLGWARLPWLLRLQLPGRSRCWDARLISVCSESVVLPTRQ